ncbi:Phosphorus acquisition-controlling [Lecanosticta acicola]|uniref:Phosphorus acquisition-controlling n=1 Tax=Lecanosticta acicola TaxID=111012 RepID=A0AAI9EA88_9PEZI|nr:Phosphorus acquisition-controlling [Lecanosticta acicola]
MDTTNAQPWSRPPEQLDPMAQMSTDLDDLGNLFEFGEMDLSLQNMPSNQFGNHMRAPGTHPSTPYEEMNESEVIIGTSAQDFSGVHGQFDMPQLMENTQQRQPHHLNGHPQTTHPYTTESLYQPSMHQAYHPNQQQFQYQNMSGFPSTQHVPPTPNSFEMHGETARFMQQQMDPQQRAILEQRYQLRKEDAIAFTPMVSPAGTPQFNVQPEYTVPGAYFSPLTSPMLHAQQNGQTAHQQQQQAQQGYYGNTSTAPNSNATSPLDPNTDVDMMDDMQLPDSASPQNKTPGRRKPAAPRSGGSLAKVKQSPIQKATKRKSGTMLSSLAPTKELECMAEPPRSASSQPRSVVLQMARTNSSEDGSISPEPLMSAPIMGPPPRPGSALGNSPMLASQCFDAPAAGAPGKAATPKSLLQSKGTGQTPKSGSKSTDGRPASGADDQTEFEELQLPAAAASDGNVRPSLPQLKTQVREVSSDGTPRVPARKTPKLGASSTPASARAGSAVASPSLVGSPMTASTPGALLKDKKPDAKGARSKKRGSVSGSGSTLVSPALRPRISPSIKPLLPEGASLQSPTHALLLASKSNYQNLLEGNQLPGVHYPESLSTGLTSKRTSHKVAEQGRRNRINEALKEMQSLLPKAATMQGAKEHSNSDGTPEAPETQESKEEAAVKSNSSKAATVESANEYIRRLQKENEDLQKKNKEHENRLRKLEGQVNGSCTSSEKSAASPMDASTS